MATRIRRRVGGTLLSLVLSVPAAVALPADTQSPAPREQLQLKDLIILIGAQDGNDAFARTVPPGQLTQPLTLRVLAAAPAGAQQGELAVTEFVAQQEPAQVVAAVLRATGGGQTSPDSRRVAVALTAPGWIDVELQVGPLRPSTTYKGRLVIAAGILVHRWDVTLMTGGRGILAVDPIGPIKLVTFHPCAWFTRISAAAARCEARTRTFPVTVRDKSENGPYTALRVRFEPSGAPATKTIASNFSLDALSFWALSGTKWEPLDLAHRAEDSGGAPSGGLSLDRRGQRTFAVRAESLGPGEYAGTVRFAAGGASDDAPESKLSLNLQVRHHWTLPVVVILLGSLVGWFSSKYVVGVRRARALRRQVQALRARGTDLARPGPSRVGWHFPSEATSYGLARARVMLHQLADVSLSALRVLIADEEIRERAQDAERRIAGLERLRAARVKVEPVTDGRPAAQVAVGRLFRQAIWFLDRPTFGDAEQADFTKVLENTDRWVGAETREACYRGAVADRRRSRELPAVSVAQAVTDQALRTQLTTLVGGLPSDKDMEQANIEKLETYDQTIAQLALLWRERDFPWAGELVKASAASPAGAGLDALFRIADTGVWGMLETAASKGELHLTRDRGGPERVETQDLVEVRLTSTAPNLPDQRIVYHPLRVGWTITPPDGEIRSAETDGLTLVQYFPDPGLVRVNAVLCWEGPEIKVPEELPFTVVLNPDYKPRAFFGEWTEHAVTAVAALFAVLTAMGTLYDATFGTFGQYLSVFLWAAGAGAGGNLFKQLGTSPSPMAGGQADVTLPSGAGSGAAART